MRVFLFALALSTVACDSSMGADDIACGPTYPCGPEAADATLADVHVSDAGDATPSEDGACEGDGNAGRCAVDGGEDASDGAGDASDADGD